MTHRRGCKRTDLRTLGKKGRGKTTHVEMQDFTSLHGQDPNLRFSMGKTQNIASLQFFQIIINIFPLAALDSDDGFEFVHTFFDLGDTETSAIVEPEGTCTEVFG
jgi:hypothetical protein